MIYLKGWNEPFIWRIFKKQFPSFQADDFGPLNFFEFFKNHCAMLATKQEYNKVLGSAMHIGSFGGNFYV